MVSSAKEVGGYARIVSTVGFTRWRKLTRRRGTKGDSGAARGLAGEAGAAQEGWLPWRRKFYTYLLIL